MVNPKEEIQKILNVHHQHSGLVSNDIWMAVGRRVQNAVYTQSRHSVTVGVGDAVAGILDSMIGIRNEPTTA